MFVYVCGHGCVCLSACLSVRKRVFVYVVYGCVCTCVLVYVCVCVCMCVRACVHFCMVVYVCIRLFVHVHGCGCFEHARVFVYA